MHLKTVPISDACTKMDVYRNGAIPNDSSLSHSMS